MTICCRYLQSEGKKMSEVSFSEAIDAQGKLAFAKEMQRRMFAGDKNVFKDCCTEDFRHRTPEFHFITPAEDAGWLKGEFAIETMSRYFRSDGGGWAEIKVTDVSAVETNDLLIWEFVWSGDNPTGPYGGFEDGERREGMHVDMRVVEYWRFRDGKVCEIDACNDSLGYYYDMADGNWDLIVKAIKNNIGWWAGQRENIEKGEYPIPDPGNVFDDERS